MVKVEKRMKMLVKKRRKTIYMLKMYFWRKILNLKLVVIRD